jgi:hypothetical protein
MVNLIKLNEKKIKVFKNAIVAMANFKKVFNKEISIQHSLRSSMLLKN